MHAFAVDKKVYPIALEKVAHIIVTNLLKCKRCHYPRARLSLSVSLFNTAQVCIHSANKYIHGPKGIQKDTLILESRHSVSQLLYLSVLGFRLI